jgi:hypothetical protein
MRLAVMSVQAANRRTGCGTCNQWHTSSPNTVWDVRIGHLGFSQDNNPSTGDVTTPHRLDNVTNMASGAPRRVPSVLPHADLRMSATPGVRDSFTCALSIAVC